MKIRTNMLLADFMVAVCCVILLFYGWYYFNAYNNEVDTNSSLQQQVKTLEVTNNNLREYVISLESELPTFGDSSIYGTERDNQKIIHEELGGQMEYRLNDGTRIDLLIDEPNPRAVEIDWDKKWAEGLGQAIYYMMAVNTEVMQQLHRHDDGGEAAGVTAQNMYQPLVILLAKGADSGWEKYRDRVQLCRMRCWVFDAKTKTWLDKED